MKKSEVFAEEMALIKNEKLKNVVADFFDYVVPDYFFKIPASSSGKHHPRFASGEGGLVRHTKMVVAVAITLAYLGGCKSGPDTDIIVAACLLHDTFKNGHVDAGRSITSHPVIAKDEFEKYTTGKESIYYERGAICRAIQSHMGRWYDIEPESGIQKIVHVADFIASRKFFDMDNLQEGVKDEA